MYNNINNNHNNEYNNKLYNSVFNNIYLKKIIFNHLTTYNILYSIHFELEKWQQFKYKDYLNNVSLNYELENLKNLPENIKHIDLWPNNRKFLANNLNSIPDHIESIKLSTIITSSNLNQIISTSSNILSKIISLNINLEKDYDQTNFNKILQSITHLTIGSESGVIKNGIISSNLKRIGLIKIESIENQCLLESLSYARLFECSISILNQLSSNSLVKLEIFKKKFDITKDSDIIFPETLQELYIKCGSFNTMLPSNLKSLKLEIDKFENSIIFPSSLEHINIYARAQNNKEIFNNRESVPCNLRSLNFASSCITDNNGDSIFPNKLEKLTFNSSSTFNQVLQVNQLPSSLTYLDLGYSYNQVIEVNVLPSSLTYLEFSDSYNQVLEVNQLPSSLTYLDLGDSYNQVIDVNVLPSSLRTLKLGNKYRQIINPLAIPQQLEILEIRYDYLEYLINLPVSTHPNTLIICKYLNLYYSPSNSSIRKLKLPDDFKSPLSTLQLQDKSSLEYLHLGYRFSQTIELSDLPINNNIKTLVLGSYYNKTINLEYFQNLETLILESNTKANIKTTTITNQQEIIYNNYNLKNIVIESNYKNEIIFRLDRNFYQFIKIKKPNNYVLPF